MFWKWGQRIRRLEEDQDKLRHENAELRAKMTEGLSEVKKSVAILDERTIAQKKESEGISLAQIVDEWVNGEKKEGDKG